MKVLFTSRISYVTYCQQNSFVATSLFLGSALLLTFIAKEAYLVVSPIFFSLTSNCAVGISFFSAMQDGNQSMVTNEIIILRIPFQSSTSLVFEGKPREACCDRVVDKQFPQIP